MQNSSKKRILYVITKSNFGGAQRYLFELAHAMKDHGHTVSVVCGVNTPSGAFAPVLSEARERRYERSEAGVGGGDGELVERLRAVDIEVHTIPSWKRDVHLREEWQAFRTLHKIFTTWKPDVVHLNSSKAGGLGALAARLAGVPHIIFTAHGWAFLENRNPFWKVAIWLLSYVTALLCHRVIVVSKNDERHAPMFFLTHRCEIVHTAVPTFELVARADARATLFDDETISTHAHDVWLISIAELTANKNLDTAIRAVAEFNRTHQQQIFYTLIGDGELRETLKGLVRGENAESQITFLGHIRDARTYLDAFDLFILPSLKEGFPYAILEAGIAHLPVIASRVGGIPEIIADRETGMLIEPRNHITILQAFKALIHDTEMRTHVADTLHTRVRTEFGLTSMIKKTEALYNS